MKAPTHLVNESSNGYSDDIDIMISNGVGDRREEFAEYLWMEDIEGFDKQVLAELEEEEEIEQCMAEMLAEEEARDTTYYTHPLDEFQSESIMQRLSEEELTEEMSHLTMEELIQQTGLNPYAAEFVPSSFTDSSTDSDSSEASDR